jgi:hypothetical protein
MKPKTMFYAAVGFATYKIGKRVAKRKARQALLGSPPDKGAWSNRMSAEASRPADNPLRLVCGECGREAGDTGKGWQGLHERQDNDTVTVVVLCPECWAKEFADD